MKKIAYCLVLLISACTEFDIHPEFHIAKDAKLFVDQFFQEAAKRNIILTKDNLIVVMDNTNNHGVDAFKPGTFFHQGVQKVILLDQWTFDIQKSNENKLIVFHELGHALLNLPHDDTHKCIMNTSPDISLLEKDQEAFIDDLFMLGI